jgi:hypothetical protein
MFSILYLDMAKKPILTIDLNVWCTLSERSKLENIKLGALSARLVRTKRGKTPNPIEYWEIKDLGITLVKRK